MKENCVCMNVHGFRMFMSWNVHMSFVTSQQYNMLNRRVGEIFTCKHTRQTPFCWVSALSEKDTVFSEDIFCALAVNSIALLVLTRGRKKTIYFVNSSIYINLTKCSLFEIYYKLTFIKEKLYSFLSCESINWGTLFGIVSDCHCSLLIQSDWEV